MTKIILKISVVLFLAGCNRPTPTVDPVVARVGQKVITVSEFRRNYEFGLSHLKQGHDPKRTYLEFMIKEQVLAQAGYHLGLDSAAAVQTALRQLEDELLIEELFLDQVHRKIKISDDEIRQAINQNKVSWKFRYWFEPTLEGAQMVARAMRERGYAEVVQDFLARNPETPLKPHDFESDYVTWLDVPEPLLNALKDLPRGEISDPVALDGVFYIFQITDIRQQGVLENEYASQAASMKKVLYYRKVMEQGVKYVADLMTPKEVVTKRNSFRMLADALAEWKNAGEKLSISQAVAAATAVQPALAALKANFSETLVEYAGGSWSFAEFLAQNPDWSRLTANPEDTHLFQNQVNDVIALTIRNHFLLVEARRKKLEKSENIQKQLADWRDKWVYQETRFAFTRELHLSPEQQKQYFENHRYKYKIRGEEPTFNEFKTQVKQDAWLHAARKILEAKVDSLAPYIPVEINAAVLDTIHVTASKKSKWMSVQLFKRSNNRLAFPIVDPAWGL